MACNGRRWRKYDRVMAGEGVTTGRLVLATRNAHKVLELKRILHSAGLGDVDLVGLDAFPAIPDVAETEESFHGNALLKAEAVSRATGLIAVADDSGLTVDALSGMPGIFSARWSGRHGDDQANLDLLLGQLSDVPDGRRGGAFVCAAVAVLPTGGRLIAEGQLRGSITRNPRGSNGFGYDPIFVPAGHDRTTAEMTAHEKDAISHRGIAFRELATELVTSLSQADFNNSGRKLMSNTPDPVDADAAVAVPVGFFDLDGVQLPVFDLAAFNADDLHRVSSFSTNFGHWQLPAEVGALLGVQAGQEATLEWIHDTGELVLLGGVPTGSAVSVESAGVDGLAGVMPGFLGGSLVAGGSGAAGMVRYFIRSEVMPAGSRVALLAHIEHGPKAHEVLWSWHREQRKETGWNWLVERLARLNSESSGQDHLA